jgi:hypothetical protein
MSWGVGWKTPTLVAVLCVFALTVWATAADAISWPWGLLVVAICTTLVGVTSGYIPSIRESVLRRHRELKAARAAWDAVGEPVAKGLPVSPAGWLRADRAVVEFTGREAELAELRAWYESEGSGPVRVLVGGGGVGKTRLALQVAAEWVALGAEWQMVTPGQESGAVAAARGVTSGPVLLVVDYAETRAGLEELLRAVLGDPEVLVLLVARSLGEWWDRLVEKTPAVVRQMLSAVRPVRLDTPVKADVSDADLVWAAVPYFCRALGIDQPKHLEFDLPPGRAPMLVLHAAALVAVLRFQSDPRSCWIWPPTM